MLSGPETIFISIAVCLAATVALGAILRREGVSLGIPFAYALLVLLEHLPGAWGAAIAGVSYQRLELVQSGISITAIGLCAFAVGAWVARKRHRQYSIPGSSRRVSFGPTAVPQRFLIFCLVGGWLLTFGVRAIVDLPSINAVVEKGGAIWLLAVMIGIASAAQRRSVRGGLAWGAALMVYPLVILVVGGFMSWGSASIVLATSVLCAVMKRYWVVLIGVAIGGVIGLSLFVSYFEIRSDLRAAAWGGAPISERAAEATKIITEFELLSPDNPAHLDALDTRLNQNYFIGLSAERLE